MNFYVLTLFPEMIVSGLNTSVIGRAIEKEAIHLEAINIRNYANNKHLSVDDYPYGGGAGMVMKAEPIYLAVSDLTKKITQNQTREINSSPAREINSSPTRVIYLTPQGQVFNQTMAQEYAKETDLIFLCGHYEGIDERALNMCVTDMVSIGDYVLTGGELAAMVMIDAIARFVPNVLSNDTSAEFESFHDNLLEYPQYTRPEVFMDQKVPDILLSGHHANIERWRREQSLLRTKERRPDLLKGANLSERDRKFLGEQ